LEGGWLAGAEFGGMYGWGLVVYLASELRGGSGCAIKYVILKTDLNVSEVVKEIDLRMLPGSKCA
jgi:hypothetical protein